MNDSRYARRNALEEGDGVRGAFDHEAESARAFGMSALDLHDEGVEITAY